MPRLLMDVDVVRKEKCLERGMEERETGIEGADNRLFSVRSACSLHRFILSFILSFKKRLWIKN